MNLNSAPLLRTSARQIIQQIQNYRVANEKKIVAEFFQLLAIPNHAANVPDVERNAHAIAKMLERRGVAVRLLGDSGTPPLVYGELRAPGNSLTLGIYAHYDGQPVNPAEWSRAPFSPVLCDASGDEMDWHTPGRFDPEWRIYARSASDDKAPIESVVAAMDALHATHIPLSANVKFMFEGEEEVGSPHIEQVLDRHPDVLQADVWLLCDGHVHPSRRMQLFFGSRGAIDLEMTVYGPAHGLHSGHYGNWAPNPIALLSHLLASMRAPDGKILVPGFYDDVRALSATEREALASAPEIDKQLQQEFAIATPEGHRAGLAAQILQPAMNLRGIESGDVGPQAANVIPSEAVASIDFRLVPNQIPRGVQDKVEQFLSRQGWLILHETPDLAIRRAHSSVVKLEWGNGYPAYRAAMDGSIAAAVAALVEQALGGRLIKVVSVGGSAPMYLLAGKHDTPVIGLPIANHDNNQHAANENLRLQNLWDAIDVYAFLFAQLKKN